MAGPKFSRSTLLAAGVMALTGIIGMSMSNSQNRGNGWFATSSSTSAVSTSNGSDLPCVATPGATENATAAYPVAYGPHSGKAIFQEFENGYLIWNECDQELLAFQGKTGGVFGIWPSDSFNPPELCPGVNGLDTTPGQINLTNLAECIWHWESNVTPVGPSQTYTAIITPYPALDKDHYGFAVTIPDGRTMSVSENRWWNF